MHKKIKINEDQYNSLVKYINENKDISDTLLYVKSGDVVSFKTAQGLKFSVTISSVDHNSGEILAKSDKGDGLQFSMDGYDEGNKQLVFKRIDQKTKKTINEPVSVTDIFVVRDGKELEIPKIEPQATPKIEPTNVEPDKPSDDEISPSIDLDPSTPSDDLDKNTNISTFDIQNAIEMIVKDPDMQKAFYSKPSFMSLLMAELRGKSATGEGIFPMLNIVSKVKTRKLKGKLGSAFVPSTTANFILVDRPIKFDWTVKGVPHSYVMDVTNVNQPYYAVVQKPTFKDTKTYENYVLVNNDKNFKIYVKDRTNTEDEYICDIEKYIKTEGQLKTVGIIRDVTVKFLPSKGYQPEKKI